MEFINLEIEMSWEHKQWVPWHFESTEVSVLWNWSWDRDETSSCMDSIIQASWYSQNKVAIDTWCIFKWLSGTFRFNYKHIPRYIGLETSILPLFVDDMSSNTPVHRSIKYLFRSCSLLKGNNVGTVTPSWNERQPTTVINGTVYYREHNRACMECYS